MSERPLINLDELELMEHRHGERYQALTGSIGEPIGARQLGSRLVVLPPGKRAWPYHLHHANEEMFVILSGTGTLRFDGREYPLRAGDVIAAPAGPNTAHQIVNTSDAELRYVAISTMREPEIAEYPDTGKFMAATGPDRAFRHIGRTTDALDYWDGEG